MRYLKRAERGGVARGTTRLGCVKARACRGTPARRLEVKTPTRPDEAAGGLAQRAAATLDERLEQAQTVLAECCVEELNDATAKPVLCEHAGCIRQARQRRLRQRRRSKQEPFDPLVELGLGLPRRELRRGGQHPLAVYRQQLLKRAHVAERPLA